MSGIVSSVGLASGLPIQDIIDQLIAVESRPYLLTLQWIEAIQQKRASYTTLNAQLLALKNAVTQFDRLGFFRRSQATSSNATVLSALAADGAVEGSYAFRVQSLVTSHQLISNGFADADQTAVGVGTISFEIGNGKLEFDEARFREAFGEDPDAVEKLFTLSDTKQELDSSGNPVINPNTGEPVEEFVGLGFGFRIDDVLDALTRTFDGLLASKDNTLRSQEDLLSDWAEFLLTLLDGKRARLELRFARPEQSLNALTGQQSVLNVLAASAASFR